MRDVFHAERTFSKTFTFLVPNMWKGHDALCFGGNCIIRPFSYLLISEKEGVEAPIQAGRQKCENTRGNP